MSLATMNDGATSERAEGLRLLRDSAVQFTARSTDHKRTRALRETLPGYDADLAASMAELGWCGIVVPEAHGGLGLGVSEMAAVLQELGKGLLAEPLVSQVALPSRVLTLCADNALKGELLPGLAGGEIKAALAWQEESGVIDPAAATTTSTGGAAARLTGRKRFVAGAAGAGGYLVTARAGKDVGVYWVEAGAPGLAVEQQWRADGTPAGVLSLADTPARLLAGSSASAGLAQALDEAAVMVAAELMGVLSQTLTLTLDYIKTRVQFDHPIGSFQALQHQAVDLLILQEVSEAVLGEAAALLDDPDTPPLERSRMSSRAKARLSEAGLRVTREAIQFHGAIAMTDDCDVGLYFKRAITLAAWLGNADAHRRRFMALGRQK
jgi:alkylation response protein AidB-like acyl-CoA dehydrogenase